MSVRVPLVHRLLGFLDGCPEILGEAVRGFTIRNTEIQHLQ